MIALFYYISILNAADAWLTILGVENRLIDEANPLMKELYSFDPRLFLGVKLLFSLVLILFIVFKKVPTTSTVKGIAIVASAFYTVVFLLHGFWLIEFI